MRMLACIAAAMVLTACQGVRVEDTAAWQGRPVNDLDLHPVFLTMQRVTTVAADGTEIRNYVNSAQISTCSGNGTIFSGAVSSATYAQFSSCMSQQAACNNIFYVKGGKVQNYTPIGSGGARCFTDERLQPKFRSATNF